MQKTGMLTKAELQEQVSAGEIDTVLACFSDMQGRLMGKRFQAQYFIESAWEEAHACNYLLTVDINMTPVPGYAAASWQQGYGDFVLKPDLKTLRLIPWLEKTALVLCDLNDHQGKPISHSPRQILQTQISRLRERGMTAMMASELEFYLFQDSYSTLFDGNYQRLQTLNRQNQDYQIFQTTKEETYMRAVRLGLEGAGIPVECSKGEWSAGQEEINIRYCEALEMADRHSILKNGMKEIAFLQYRAVSFMAKWRENVAGSSSHIHTSLWDVDGTTPLFYDPQGEYGMSALMRHFVAGQLHYARDITLFLCPYINSYKRLAAGSFAPTRAVWSRDNRTSGFRLCGEGSKGIRIECRIGGSDLNPYLAMAVLIAAGLAGIEAQLPLPPAFVGDAYQLEARSSQIPTTLREAIATTEASAMLRDALGAEVLEHYLHTARWEQAEYDRAITDWEVKRGFERY